MMLIYILISLIAVSNCNEIDTLPNFKTWVNSCKPCVDILNECLSCVGPSCIPCIGEIYDSKCAKCVNDFQAATGQIYCQQSIEYHALVCHISCRIQLSQSGTCNAVSGLCQCTSSGQTTTNQNIITTKPTSTTSSYFLFPLHLNSVLATSFGFSLNERYVDLSNRNIGSIESTFLQQFKYVDTLILKNNVILKLFTNTFKNMRYLEILDLSYNKLTTLDASTFNGAENLEVIYLNNNMLNSIENTLFINFNYLPNVNFSNNPLSVLYNIKIDPITKILIFTRN